MLSYAWHMIQVKEPEQNQRWWRWDQPLVTKIGSFAPPPVRFAFTKAQLTSWSCVLWIHHKEWANIWNFESWQHGKTNVKRHQNHFFSSEKCHFFRCKKVLSTDAVLFARFEEEFSSYELGYPGEMYWVHAFGCHIIWCYVTFILFC